ncbi:MAG: hypothetical protein P8M80_08540 [Pirellulaceae bacterium]|nr:hypothetical protein [Pirellulaceae bacterium]
MLDLLPAHFCTRWMVLLFWGGVISISASSSGQDTSSSGQKTLVVGQKIKETGKAAENLILITVDGLRWQEVFGGADQRLMTKENGVRDVGGLRGKFWRETAEDRRQRLLPFFWKTIAASGQIIGDPAKDSRANTTNGFDFSYPGYNEILTGRADPRVSSNSKTYNRNMTFLEWLNQQKSFEGRVAAFCSWDVFPFIINDKRSGIYVNAGWVPIEFGEMGEVTALNRFAAESPRVWPNVRMDVFTVDGAIAYLKSHKPKVLYVAVGETDDWAHDGRYDMYLESAYRTDQYIQRIWKTLQSIPQYRDKTTMLLTTDHGRGDGREGWKNHGVIYPGSDRIWVAAIGQGVAPLGNRAGQNVEQSQIAATAVGLLGYDYAPNRPFGKSIDLRQSKPE